ncbi:hypothetical protein J6590_034110 [Homalodisca vitripennis]|nr:hypothetical protein J6590_034110 [Homalodisca vitripennis]
MADAARNFVIAYILFLPELFRVAAEERIRRNDSLSTGVPSTESTPRPRSRSSSLDPKNSASKRKLKYLTMTGDKSDRARKLISIKKFTSTDLKADLLKSTNNLPENCRLGH